MKRSHTDIARDALARACAEAAAKARKAERAWWRQQLSKAIASAEEMGGQGMPVSASLLVAISEKRGGEP